MADNTIQDLIGQYIIQPLPININREYNEFNLRLQEKTVGGNMDWDTLFSSIESADSSRISLCTFDRTLQEIKMDSILDRVDACRSPILQIFMHPKIHLKELQQVLPIEVVSRVGHESIRHLASHSEHWESVRVSGLVPARLLARTLEDEYAIYENVVAKSLVDKLYSMILRKRNELKVIEYNFETKDSVYSLSNQYPNVYAAYNVLFKGYTDDSLRDIRQITEDQLATIERILTVLAICRETLLYSKLRRAPKITGQLKPTNIFLMDKHYKCIYRLWKELSKAHLEEADDEPVEINITDEYSHFVYAQLLFALKYFNFKPQPPNPRIFEQGHIAASKYSFTKWECSVEGYYSQTLQTECPVVSMTRKTEYRIRLDQVVVRDIDSKFPVSLKENTLVIRRILTEKEQADLAYCLYPRLGGGDDEIKNERKKIRRNLRQQLMDIFHGQEQKLYRTIIVPLYIKFSDCSVDAKKALGIISEKLRSEVIDLGINTIYLSTPFSPFDYDGMEHATQQEAKYLLNYAVKSDVDRAGVLPITISDINSYRRLTKVLLYAMMQVADGYDNNTCPICGSQMFVTSNEIKKCYHCSYSIRKTRCSACNNYYTSGRSPVSKVAAKPEDNPAYRLLVTEIEQSFNNLIDLDCDNSKEICPICGATA